MRNLPRIVADTKVGKRVPIKIWRDGKLLTKTIKVEKLAKDSFAANAKPGEPEPPLERQMDEDLGAEILTITPEVIEEYSFDDDLKGVLLLNVTRDGLATFNGLQSGDVIIRVGKKSIKNVEGFKTAIDKAKKAGASSVAIYFSRKGENRFRAFRFQ